MGASDQRLDRYRVRLERAARRADLRSRLTVYIDRAPGTQGGRTCPTPEQLRMLVRMVRIEACLVMVATEILYRARVGRPN